MATNYKGKGDIVTLNWATTSPTAGDAVVKVASEAVGLVGVALNGAAVAAEDVEVQLEGIVSVPIVAAAAMKVGQTVFGTFTTGEEVCTTVLSGTFGSAAASVRFGFLLENISSAQATTKKVLLSQQTYLGT